MYNPYTNFSTYPKNVFYSTFFLSFFSCSHIQTSIIHLIFMSVYSLKVHLAHPHVRLSLIIFWQEYYTSNVLFFSVLHIRRNTVVKGCLWERYLLLFVINKWSEEWFFLEYVTILFPNSFLLIGLRIHWWFFSESCVTMVIMK